MKTRLALLLCLAFTAVTRADEPAAPAIATDSSLLTAEQLEQLVGPIALYPDALIALILPGSTAPADIVLAARYLKDDGDPAAVGSRSWDESVKSLTNYAAVVKWMDENLAWTKQLGEAFRDQPAEVMQAIQRLRTRARAAGTLQDSPQQQVLYDNDLIMIVPAQANYLYVPYYDPLVVYAPRPEYYGTTTFISYSSPFAVGAWLRFDCDWRARTVWTSDRNWASRNRHDWRRPVFPGQAGYINDPNRHPWRPPANSSRATVVNTSLNYRRNDTRQDIARPAPIDRPSRPTNNVTRDDSSDRRNDSRNRPQRTDAPTPTRDPNFMGPVAAPTTTTTTTSFASQTPSATPQPNRRNDAGRNRTDSNANANNSAQPNRTISFQNPPSSRPLQMNPAPIVSAPPQQQPTNYPYGPAPSSRIVPAFNGPVVAPMSQPAASAPLPQIRMPAAAPALAPAPAAQPPPDDRRRDRNDEERGRPQQQPE